MPLIQFVQNYEDLSTDRGYQFKFLCDKCHNGYMTGFQASAIGLAESALRVAGNLFGGVFNSVGNSAYEIQRAVGGPAHDAALKAAVEEGKQHFHQCTRCGRWVCPEVCWNAEANLCEECAPNFQEEFASAHAHAKADAARAQLRDKAAATDYVAASTWARRPSPPPPPRARLRFAPGAARRRGTAASVPNAARNRRRARRGSVPGAGRRPYLAPAFVRVAGTSSAETRARARAVAV